MEVLDTRVSVFFYFSPDRETSQANSWLGNIARSPQSRSREDGEWSRELVWKRGGVRNERSARLADLDLAVGKIAAGVDERPTSAPGKVCQRKSATEYRNRGCV
jgi:hypothetical protein